MRQLATTSLAVLASGLLAVCGLTACGPGGRPPKIDEIGDHDGFVGQELVIDLHASDPDGDVLTFGFSAPSIPDLLTRSEPATISALGTDGSAARFRWRPVARDVGSWVITFDVTDGDVSVAETASVTIKPEVGTNQQPTFVKPGGSSVDLDLTGSSKCIDVDIVVEDPDSARVTIAQEPVVEEGMRLTDHGDKTADWHWCPSPTQIDAAVRYRVHFSADDGVSGTVPKSLLVNIIKPQQMNCPGTAPVITHSPTNVTTLDPLTITAQISDDKGLQASVAPLLYYATKTPPTPIDLTNKDVWQGQEAVLKSGTTMSGMWAATVPNPVADDPAGTKATIYYVWSAVDNDDPMGACDHTTYEPRTGTFQMTVTSPGGQGNQAICTVCSADAQCGGATDNCLHIGDGNYCAKGCAGDTDCPQPEYVCSASAQTSVNGAMARQCIPRDGSCGTAPAVCTDDAREPNDSLAMASTQPGLEVSTTLDLKVCPTTTGGADEDWFKVVVAEDSELTFTLTGATDTDLDMQLTNTAGTAVGAASASTGSNEKLVRCLKPGTYYVRVYSQTAMAKEMTYKLATSGLSKSCGVTNVCMDDAFEPDDDQAHARLASLIPPKFEEKNHQICAADDDWYEVFLIKGDLLRARLAFTQTTASQDLDFHFHDEAGLDLTPCTDTDPSTCDPDNGQSADSNEYFERMITTAGFYYLRVHGFRGSENKYDICVSINADQCPPL